MITVHGIRTFGQWQQRLERLLKAADPTVEVRNYHYGYFSLIAFLIPVLRWLVTRRFHRELLREVERRPGRRVHLVAHSFGTHLVGWGLYGIPPERRPRIDTIVLAGSVLKPGFPWQELLKDGWVRRVVNECGIHDSVLLLNQAVVLLTGMAGRVGFHGMTGKHFLNRYYRLGHSGYFVGPDNPDGFMAARWVPLLTGETEPEPVDERAPGGPSKGSSCSA